MGNKPIVHSGIAPECARIRRLFLNNTKRTKLEKRIERKGRHVKHSVNAGKHIRPRVANALLITRKAVAVPISQRGSSKGVSGQRADMFRSSSRPSSMLRLRPTPQPTRQLTSCPLKGRSRKATRFTTDGTRSKEKRETRAVKDLGEGGAA